MTQSTPFQPLAYDDPRTPHEMYGDCQAVGENLHVPAPRTTEHLPAPAIEISEATALLAGSLHLHFD